MFFGAKEVYAEDESPENYLDEGEEVVFSQAIMDLADELENDPLQIINYVKNEIEYEPYYGLKKGSESTLLQKSGNDMDQASLLIALLRYSGFPARYETADVKMSIGAVNSNLGTRSAIRSAEILSLNKIPYTLYTLDGNPYFFVVEHTFVETYIPYGYSRGIDINDGGEEKWIPIDVVLSSVFYADRVDIISEYKEQEDFDVEEFYIDYLSGLYGDEEPLEAFRGDISNFLLSADFDYYDDLTYEDVLIQEYIIGSDSEFISGVLSYEILDSFGKFDYISDEYKHKIEISIDNDDVEDLSHSFSLHDISDKELVVAYQAATPDDQVIIDSFETLYDVVPLSLVEVVPMIKVNGEVVAISDAPVTLGEIAEYSLDIIAPERDIDGNLEFVDKKTIEKPLTAGVSEAFAFNTGKIVPMTHRNEMDYSSSSSIQEQKLYSTAVDYLFRLQESHDEIADLINGGFVNVSTMASIANNLEVSYIDDEPYSFEWNGLDINSFAGVRYFSKLGEEINYNRKEFLALFGLEASQDEADIFEDNYGVESVSTVKGLKLVSEDYFPGIGMHIINSDNEGDIESLNIYDSLKDVFHEAVDEGKTIYTPSEQVVYGDWEGLFYIAIDWEAGDATYAIGRGLNGGYSIEEFPEGWDNFWRENLAIGLEAVINSPSNGDIFHPGDSIPWNVSYDWLLGEWDEILSISTDGLELGEITLYSGYGTDESVTIELVLEEDQSIGDQHHDYDHYIIQYEDEFGIPRGLLKSIIHKETAGSPFEPDQYRYEPKVDYDNFSNLSSVFYAGGGHPYGKYAISGHDRDGNTIAEGDQLDDLDPVYTEVLNSRGTGGWSLRSIKGYQEGQTYGELKENDTQPGSQGWPYLADTDFTAQVVLSASYGMGHVLYLTAMSIAKDTNGDLWFDTSVSGTARSIFDMNEPETSIRLVASTLYYKYNLISEEPDDIGKCDGWGAAVRTYNGGGPAAEAYRDDVCEYYYNILYKP